MTREVEVVPLDVDSQEMQEQVVEAVVKQGPQSPLESDSSEQYKRMLDEVQGPEQMKLQLQQQQHNHQRPQDDMSFVRVELDELTDTMMMMDSVVDFTEQEDERTGPSTAGGAVGDDITDAGEDRSTLTSSASRLSVVDMVSQGLSAAASAVAGAVRTVAETATGTLSDSDDDDDDDVEIGLQTVGGEIIEIPTGEGILGDQQLAAGDGQQQQSGTLPVGAAAAATADTIPGFVPMAGESSGAGIGGRASEGSQGDSLEPKLVKIVKMELDPNKDVPVITAPTKQERIILPSKMRRLRAIGLRNRRKKRMRWLRELQEKRRQRRERERQIQYGDIAVDEQDMREKRTLRRRVRNVVKWFRGDHLLESSHSMDYYGLSPEDQGKVKALLVDLGYALGVYGLPAHRLEYHLTQVASYFGIDLYPYFVSTALWLQFGNPADRRSVQNAVKINTIDFNLQKLCLMDDVADQIALGKISIPEARETIAEIIQMRDIYSHWLFALFAFSVASAAFAVYLNGTWLEIVSSFVAGFLISIWHMVSGRLAVLSKMRDIGAALVAGVTGIVFRLIFTEWLGVRCQPFLVSIAGTFIYLPGMSITVAIAEVSTRNLLAGTTRLVGSLWALLQLGFGVMMAAKLGNALNVSLDDVTPHVNPAWAYALATFCVAFPLIIFLRAPRYPLAILFIIAACYAAFFIAHYVSQLVDSAVGIFAGSVAVTIMANIYSRISRHPSIVISACSIILLVPGSIGLRVFKGILDRDTNASVDNLLILLETCLALIFGIFAGEWIVPAPRRFSL